MSIVEHSAKAVGRTWNEVDHLELVVALQRIDETVQAVYNLAQGGQRVARAEVREYAGAAL